MRARALRFASAGIEVETDAAEGSAKFNSSSVVIADGGFQSSFDMIRAHISAAPEKLLARNGGTATGDGLRMAQAVGAASTGLGVFYGHLHSRDAMNSERLWPRPYADEIAAAGIVIDADGRRFADEGLGGIYLSNIVARLPDPLGATIVFDQAIWDGPPGRGHAQPPNPLLPEAGGTLHRAHDCGAGRSDRYRAAAAGGPCQRIQRRRRRRHFAHAFPAASQRPLQSLGDQDRAVLCSADLRGDHQHHGRHRG